MEIPIEFTDFHTIVPLNLKLHLCFYNLDDDGAWINGECLAEALTFAHPKQLLHSCVSSENKLTMEELIAMFECAKSTTPDTVFINVEGVREIFVLCHHLKDHWRNFKQWMCMNIPYATEHLQRRKINLRIHMLRMADGTMWFNAEDIMSGMDGFLTPCVLNKLSILVKKPWCVIRQFAELSPGQLRVFELDSLFLSTEGVCDLISRSKMPNSKCFPPLFYTSVIPDVERTSPEDNIIQFEMLIKNERCPSPYCCVFFYSINSSIKSLCFKMSESIVPVNSKSPSSGSTAYRQLWPNITSEKPIL